MIIHFGFTMLAYYLLQTRLSEKLCIIKIIMLFNNLMKQFLLSIKIHKT